MVLNIVRCAPRFACIIYKGHYNSYLLRPSGNKKNVNASTKAQEHSNYHYD